MGTGRSESLVARRVEEHVAGARALLDEEHVAAVAALAGTVARAVAAGGTVLLFGNGGSAADAQHLAAELLGRLRLERRALGALALADNLAAVTAIANDYDFGAVFARQLEGLARPGDVAIGLTTSGDSENVVRGLERASELGLETVALTGAAGGRVQEVARQCFRAPATDTERVQELHMLVGHIVCELVELELGGPPRSADADG